MKILHALAFFALVASLACADDIGLMGPPGEDGIDGTLYSTQITSIASDGTAEITLPEGSGGLAAPPLVACYIGWSQNGPWRVVGGSSYCEIDGTLRGPLTVYLYGADRSEHRYFRVTVVYRASEG